MSTQQTLTPEEYIDSYFDQLGDKLTATLQQILPIKAAMFKTADDIDLTFPDEVQEYSDITEGIQPVTIDGKRATGEYTMPDGTVLTIEDGKVTKVTKLTTEETLAMLRRDMKAFRSQLQAFMKENGRKPFKRTGYLKKTK